MIYLVKVDFGFIDSVLEKYDCDKTRVIAIMQDVQAEYSFLPEDALRYIAEKVGESEAEIFGVATFYENFSMNEKGKYIGAICAAPMVLGKLGILKGKKATCYPGFEKYLDGAEYTADMVTVDGNIITGRGPAAAMPYGYALLSLFVGVETMRPSA